MQGHKLDSLQREVDKRGQRIAQVGFTGGHGGLGFTIGFTGV